jgi:signal transduction histidine kinase
MKTNERIARLFDRTASLVDTNRGLRAGSANSKFAAHLAASDNAAATAMLEESHELQRHLLDVTRRVLMSGDEEHRHIGGALQDDLLQTLVGIQTRLLVLKKGVSMGARDLNKHIANVRRAVRESWESLPLYGKAVAAKSAN